MALSAAQINKIAKILGLTKRYLNAHIASLGSDLTAQDETDIAAELTRWDTSGAKFTKIRPNPKNFGAEKNPNDVKADIRKNIAVLLDIEFTPYSSIGTLQIGI